MTIRFPKPIRLTFSRAIADTVTESGLKNPVQAKESTMPQAVMTTAIDTDAIYRPAGWLRHTLGVSDHMLTHVLAYGRVRVLTNVGGFPVYNLSDIKNYLSEIGVNYEERYQSARKPIRPAKSL
jgi:hypothetical protein